MSGLQSWKPTRLKNYDYSSPGAYFLTICVKDMRCLLSSVVGADDPGGPHVCLTDRGTIVADILEKAETYYPDIRIDKYVIMPNHVHILLRVVRDPGAPGSSPPANADSDPGAPGSSPPTNAEGVSGAPGSSPPTNADGDPGAPGSSPPANAEGVSGAPRSSPPTNAVSKYVTALKKFTNRAFGENLWQRGFHDHIIRDDTDYLRRWQYIDENPKKWSLGKDEYYA